MPLEASPKFVLFNFVQLVIPVWQMHQFVRWKRHYHTYWNVAAMVILLIRWLYYVLEVNEYIVVSCV
jgi:hypothetical protein